jgi:outer membrane protein assembly factor BamB
VVNADQVLIGSFEDKCLRAMDASTGDEAWRFTTEDFIFSSPAVTAAAAGVGKSSPEMVIVTGSDSYVYGALPIRKRYSFLSFPYVCPEPVLVKCSFIYVNGSKKTVCTHAKPKPRSAFLLLCWHRAVFFPSLS